MKKSIINKHIYKIIGIVLIIIGWWIISLLIDENNLIFPSPINTIIFTIQLLKKSYIYKCMFYSFVKLIIGFLIGLIMALVLGIFSANNQKFRLIINPFITLLKSIPTAALVFMFLILVGSKNSPILMVSLVSFPILYEGISNGILNIDQNIINASKLENNNLFYKIIHIQIPLALPYIIISILSAFGLSFKIEIMAEIISGYNGYGLGCAITYFIHNDPSNMTPIFSISLLSILLILVISLISENLKNKLNNLNK